MDNIRSTSLACQVHGFHSPVSHVNHFHHIHPRGMGGPDTTENKVVVCPTGHYNIHYLLDWLLSGELSAGWKRGFASGEITLAYRGLEAINRAKE